MTVGFLVLVTAPAREHAPLRLAPGACNVTETANLCSIIHNQFSETETSAGRNLLENLPGNMLGNQFESLPSDQEFNKLLIMSKAGYGGPEYVENNLSVYLTAGLGVLLKERQSRGSSSSSLDNAEVADVQELARVISENSSRIFELFGPNSQEETVLDKMIVSRGCIEWHGDILTLMYKTRWALSEDRCSIKNQMNNDNE